MSKDDVSNRTITIEKKLEAPIDLVWEAWTDPQHIANWWAPQGMSMEVVTFEFKVGGAWKYTMPMSDGKQFISEGIFKEIVAKEKIVTSADFKPMTEGVELQISFLADGDKTQLHFSVIHPTEEYCRQQEKLGIYNGWGSAFERLSERLEKMSKNQ